MVRSMPSESLRAVISQTLSRDGGGRVAAHEIMIGTPAIRNLIREGKIAQMYLDRTGQAAGMQTLDQCLAEMVSKGLVSKEEARYKAATRTRCRRGIFGPQQSHTRRGIHGSRSSHQAHAGVAKRAQSSRKASDLFITAGFPPAIKLDGEIRPQMERVADAGAVGNAGSGDHERSADQGIRCHQGMQFRHSTAGHRPLPRQCVRAAEPRRLRDPPHQRQDSLRLEELELPPVLKEVVLSKRGLVMVVGGTGSGKSTALAAMVGYRNDKTRGHIVTIEDPVEYVHQHKGCVITHREVGVDTESWHAALKNTLRQAPDVILIGEIRERETMDTASSSPRPATWCWRRCTPTAPTRRSTGSSTSSPRSGASSC